MANELDSLDYYFVECENCGDVDEVYEHNEPYICFECAICENCGITGYGCECENEKELRK